LQYLQKDANCSFALNKGNQPLSIQELPFKENHFALCKSNLIFVLTHHYNEHLCYLPVPQAHPITLIHFNSPEN